MMERFNNMSQEDSAPTESAIGVGRMINTEEDMKMALGDAIALQRMDGGNILENFLKSELEDLLAIAEKDPNFRNVLANAVKDYPSVLSAMSQKPDMDEVRGVTPMTDEGLATGAMGAMGAMGNMGRISDMPNALVTGVEDIENFSKFAEESPVQGFFGPFDRDLAASTEGGYGREPMPMEYASGGYVNKPMEYAYGGYVNKPRAMGHGGYVQGQGSSMDMAEKENVRPVNRTLSTALSPTLSIKLFG